MHSTAPSFFHTRPRISEECVDFTYGHYVNGKKKMRHPRVHKRVNE